MPDIKYNNNNVIIAARDSEAFAFPINIPRKNPINNLLNPVWIKYKEIKSKDIGYKWVKLVWWNE